MTQVEGEAGYVRVTSATRQQEKHVRMTALEFVLADSTGHSRGLDILPAVRVSESRQELTAYLVSLLYEVRKEGRLDILPSY